MRWLSATTKRLLGMTLCAIGLVSLTLNKSLAVSEHPEHRMSSEGSIDLNLISDDPLVASYLDDLCVGAWPHTVSDVRFYKEFDGTLTWSYRLMPTTRTLLGGTVTTYIASASINGLAINPPYSSHTEASTYDFHSSLRTYQYLRPLSGSAALLPGDWVLIT
jgi:hypothetical protein